MKKIFSVFTMLLLLVIVACQMGDPSTPAGTDGWLKGNEQEKFETIAHQLRGFDLAMVETGYRYQELYWAGQDQNWDYAKYHLEKIELAIKNGLERRPKRAPSSEHFLSVILPEMQKAINSKDTLEFDRNFQALTTNCNSCHAMEKVPFFNVQIPTQRNSPNRM